ncbi:hypothetical protein [Fulvimarina sp. MAC3]|uniref:hypothetical protein n=1 Tax=Fulvimarina sp. MAC3 TaxID=3148887 RepID=UPI0031FC58A9
MTPSTILIAIGAALTSALLFAGLATQSALAVGFALATPVPIAIAGLGWGSAAGFIAAFAAPVLIFVFSGNLPTSLTLAIAMTIPTAVCCHLAQRKFAVAPPIETPHSPHDIQPSDAAIEWMPIGRILFVLTTLAAIACVLIGWLLGYDADTVRTAMTAAFVESGNELDAAAQLQLKNLVSVIVDLVPLIQPSVLTLTLVVCLHLGSAIARRSGRLERPKDDLPAVTSLPQDALLLFALTLSGTFLTGSAGLIATVFAGAFGTAFALVGLARLHKRTQGRPARGLILFVVYTAILFLTFPLFVFVIIGIVDVWRHGERLLPSRPG